MRKILSECKIRFSVGPIPGFRVVNNGFWENASQADPARDRAHPSRPLNKVRVFVPKDEFFGGLKSQDYLSPVLRNPSWRKIKGIAQAAMRKTGDEHHQFLEGIHWTGKQHEDGSDLIELYLGS